MIFDPLPLGLNSNEKDDKDIDLSSKSNLQGSRVSHITLSDGTTIETGASIAFTGNKLVKQMADTDTSLSVVEPFFANRKNKEESTSTEPSPDDFGIWSKTSSMIINTFGYPPWFTTLKFLYRYNIDLIRLSSLVTKALHSFDHIYEYLESDHPQTFFNSSNEMWKAVGLANLIPISFEEILDQIQVSSSPETMPWWRRLLPYQGNLREELLTAVNLCNYNQDNANLNGLVGLISFVPTKGELFSIAGGNKQLISSAFRKAQETSIQNCMLKTESKDNDNALVQHIQKQITQVISDTETLELWSGEEMMGNFDVVILAAPLQQCQVNFLIKSHFDAALLQEMPLNGMIDSDKYDANEHFHKAPPLPLSATNRYTQVVTTILSNATVNYAYFNMEKENFPRSVYVTKETKETEKFQSMTQITADGVFKLFSSEKLSTDTLDTLFQPGYIVEHVKVWGGPYGGATPNFGGGGEASTATPYLLYDGGIGWKGHSAGPGLYYINSIEAAAAAMEISAIGAKSVAKLVAQRLNLLKPSKDDIKSEL